MVEKNKLESIIEKTSNQLTQKDTTIRERDEKLEDMKTIVSRLTGTNNELLAILSTKVRLEESLKSLESANRKLIQVMNYQDFLNLTVDPYQTPWYVALGEFTYYFLL